MAALAKAPRTWAVAVSSLVALGLSGCGGGDDDTEKPDDGPVIALTGEAEVWPAAMVVGRLTEQEGCLLIDDAVAIFPVGTGWDPPRVTFDTGESVEVGTRVRMAGGTGDIAELADDSLPLVPFADLQACGERTGAEAYVLAAPSE